MVGPNGRLRESTGERTISWPSTVVAGYCRNVPVVFIHLGDGGRHG